MLHYFNVEVAKQYGIKDAVVLQSLAFWLKKNVDNKNNVHDGVVWTFNSVNNMLEYFPYLTYNKLADSLRRLEKNGLITSSNYNKMGYDRTKWYTLTPLGESLTGTTVRCAGGDFGRSRAARKARFQEQQEKLGENNQSFGENNQRLGENSNPIVEISTMVNENVNDGCCEKERPIPIIETNIEADIANINNIADDARNENQEVSETINAENRTHKPSEVTALGIWKHYNPNTDLGHVDILGAYYEMLGSFKFTNLAEEAAHLGINKMLDLLDLCRKMEQNGDINYTQTQRKVKYKSKNFAFDKFDVTNKLK